VVTAPLSSLAEHGAALSGRAAALPGGEQLTEMRKAWTRQLGFDPLTREGLLSAGLDPARGAAVALLAGDPRPEWIVALPLTRPDVFLAAIQRLLVERAGFAPVAQQPQAAKVFDRGASGQKIAVAVVRGYGLIARGADPAALVAERKPEEGLARDPGLNAARQRLGAQDIIVYAPAGSELPKRYTVRPVPGDVALSLQGSAQGIAARLLFQLPPADAARAQAALPGGGSRLVELLPGNAPLRARLGVAPGRLLDLARAQPAVAALLERVKGLDLEKDLFGALQPGVVLSLGLTKAPHLGQAVDYGFDWRRKSPFDTVQLVALAQVADKARLLRAMEALARTLPELGAKAARAGDDFDVTYSGGKGARFGVRAIEGGEIAYLMGGPLRPEELQRTPRGTNPEAAALYDDQGAAARVDFGKLSDALRVLPEGAYGTGPQSYVARSLVGQVIEPLRPVRITVAAQAHPESLEASIDLEIVAP
jgi:hypothetical protein